MTAPIPLLVTVDTESDAWAPTRDDKPCDNLRRIPHFDAFLERLGLRATYLATWRVATDGWGGGMLAELQRSGRAELGSHLHPWSCPPVTEAFSLPNTMCANLPEALQREKLARLTECVAELRGSSPLSFRAGRWGFDTTTASAVMDCGYQVDASVTPWFSWEEFDGPSFVGAPSRIYRIRRGGSVLHHHPEGQLVEVPLTSGYTRRGFTMLHRVREVLTGPVLNKLRLAGVAWALGLLRRVSLAPEESSVDNLLALARQSVAHGARHLALTLHSQSLTPGLVPHVRSARDVARVYARLEGFVHRLRDEMDIRPGTLAEMPALAQPASPGPSAPGPDAGR